ncbi:phosphate transport system permease protein PstA [bacterium BMS3Abin05]|nr:phosphate transport system permease protein PstA [bacterium BMS3Abin05]GBE28276.1 phosphate transport system permease protein PstA [bacterium BMS3Bbin03]
MQRRIIKDKLFEIIIIILAMVSTLPLILILFQIVKKGIASINWSFFVNLPQPPGETGGGVSNAILGTFILIVIAGVFSILLGVLGGTFISEYKDKKISELIRLCVNIFQGIPSIVIGIIVYIWIVMPLHRFSALSGGIALGIMMLPLIVKSTEETLRLIPSSLKEASLALGASYTTTMLRVILPAGINGILSGILISVSRVAGETAPLLFTAFGNPFMNFNIFKPVDSLPLLIFNYSMSPYPEWHSIAWGASFVLISFIIILNILTKMVSRKWKTVF